MSEARDAAKPLPTVACDNCGCDFPPDRQPVRDDFDNNRCQFCGHPHSSVMIRNKFDDRVVYDHPRDPRRDVPTGRKLYVFQAGDCAKIGVSKNPDDRLSQIQTSNAKQVERVRVWAPEDAYSAEAAIHNKLFDRKQRGEWFDISDRSAHDLADAIELFLTGHEDGI